MTIANEQQSRRFYAIDVLRGVAALVVVIWHWQLFFSPSNQNGVVISTAQQPFYAFLFVFYHYGSAAVQLFFCLSGFVFFYFYRAPIRAGVVGFGEYLTLRLSRLYPLHLLSLLLVAAMQGIYSRLNEQYFVYPAVDLKHLLLNLLLASAWGFGSDYSFNGPAWSVSVEMLLYLLFFVLARYSAPGVMSCIALTIFGHFVVSGFNVFLSGGVEFFFLGGMVCLLMKKIESRPSLAWAKSLVHAATALIWAALIAYVWFKVWRPVALAPWMKLIDPLLVVTAVFPLTVLSFALLDSCWHSFWKRLSLIGDLSYTTYMLHFPLQLLFVIVVAVAGLDPALFREKWALLGFLACLLASAALIYFFYELPAKHWLRRRSVAVPAG